MSKTSGVPPKPSYSARQAYFRSRVLRELFRDEKATAEGLTGGLELTIVARTYQPQSIHGRANVRFIRGTQ